MANGELFKGMDVKVAAHAQFAEEIAEFYTILRNNGLPVDVCGNLSGVYINSWFNSMAFARQVMSDGAKEPNSGD